MPPPYLPAELPDRVQLVSVSVPWLKIPPPWPKAVLVELPDKVELVSVSVPWLQIPPPLLYAELPEITMLASAKVPAPLKKTPPPEPLFPLAMVRPRMLALAAAMFKTWYS